METLSRVRLFTTSTNFQFPTTQSQLFSTIIPFHRPHILSTRIPRVPVSRTSPPPVSEVVEDDVLLTFFKEREQNGDFISKASDILWQREVMKTVDAEASMLVDTPQQPEEVIESDYEGGFLKLTRTQEWVLGDNSAPINRKAIAKALQDDSERRKKMSFLQYEALKRELLLLSVGIGTACSGYCLIALSVQAAISYAIGVLFSCLYLQLLYQYVDNICKEKVPSIFTQKKFKKIGIRSGDLKDFFERTIKGSSMAVSSPRLVIPAIIYGLWILSHQHFATGFFDFQLTPAMIGLFAYKAAALVQVYRDNEDLQIIFPDTESSGD